MIGASGYARTAMWGSNLLRNIRIKVQMRGGGHLRGHGKHVAQNAALHQLWRVCVGSSGVKACSEAFYDYRFTPVARTEQAATQAKPAKAGLGLPRNPRNSRKPRKPR